MSTHVYRLIAVPLAVLMLSVPAAAQDKGAAPAAAGTVATVNGKAIPQSRLDMAVRARVAQGQPDSPELRAALKQELITREVVHQEALKRGLDKNPEVLQQVEVLKQEVLIQALLQDYARKNHPTEAVLRAEYDKIKAQQGDKEYRARHILVKTEEEAKDTLAQLAKGAKFETLASERSLDTGSKANGGDLNFAPPARYVKPFAEALTKLKKGETTKTPVQTQFGWHIIQLTDERAMKVPTFEEAKDRLAQMMAQQSLQKVVAELRAKSKITE
jgi:peptidyl-prolyl cis-trans isomerase C